VIFVRVDKRLEIIPKFDSAPFFGKTKKLTLATVDLLPRRFGRYDGKDANRCAIKAIAVNRAVLR